LSPCTHRITLQSDLSKSVGYAALYRAVALHMGTKPSIALHLDPESAVSIHLSTVPALKFVYTPGTTSPDKLVCSTIGIRIKGIPSEILVPISRLLWSYYTGIASYRHKKRSTYH
jgi:hypothetical protein